MGEWWKGWNSRKTAELEWCWMTVWWPENLRERERKEEVGEINMREGGERKCEREREQ